MKTNIPKWTAILCTALFAVAGARAADIVWTNTVGGNWNAAGSWSPNQVPTAADNAFITNSGTYTVTMPDAVNGTNGNLTLGGASGTQTLSLGRSVLTLNGASLVNPNGHLALTVANSTVTGPGNLTVNGTLDWANGTMSGAGATIIGSTGVLTIGNGGVTLGRTLNNGGAGTWSGGNLTLSAGVAFNNLAGGTFDITADGRLSGGATTPINNSGLFRQAAGTAGTIITVPFTNHSGSSLQVLAATLSLNSGGTHSGIISNAPGATLQFGGGTHVLSAGSVVTGAGVLGVSGGATVVTNSGTFASGSTLSLTAGAVTLSPSCNVTAATLNLGGGVLNFNSSGTVDVVNVTAGTLGGTSPVTVTGPLTLGGGTVTNALVTANGGLNLNGGVTLNGGKLVNSGMAIWSAGNFTGANGAVFSNLLGATFINTFDGNAPSGAGATPLWVNAGLFQKTNGTAAAGATSIDFSFINTGTVEAQTNTLRYTINHQTAGLTLLDGGGLAAQNPQPLQFLGGTLMGTGLVTLANTQYLTNSGSFSPGLPLGEVDISGNYRQTVSGALNIELGGYLPGTNFDLVTVSGGGGGGAAKLGGTLNVTIINGFSPTNGAMFTFLTAGSLSGTFATFNYPSNDIGMQLSTDLTSATLKVTNLKPVVANPIVDPAPITYGEAFNFQFPANTFTDPDGDTLSYTASGMPTGVGFDGATRTFSGTPTQAGVFPVAVAATDNGTPSLTVTNTFTITINKATPTASLAVNNSPVTYDGTARAATVGISASSVPGAVANILTGGTATQTNAGTYAVTADFVPTDTVNYNSLLAQAAGNFVISKATPTASLAVNNSPVTYDGTAKAATVGISVSSVPGAVANILTGGTATQTNAGSYAVTADFVPTDMANYNSLLAQAAGNFVISKATPTASLAVNNSPVTYDGTAKAAAVGISASSVPGAVANILTGGTATETNAGTYAVTADFVPTDAGNYNSLAAQAAGNFVISKATVTPTIVANNKVYDGGTNATLSSLTLTGVIAPDVVSLTNSAASFATATVGNGKTVTASGLGLTGVQAGNYQLSAVTATDLAAITALGITGSFTASDRVYDGTTNASVLTRTLNGVLAGDTANVSLTGGTASFANANVGSGKLVTLTGATLTGNATTNYNLTSVGTTTGTINPLGVTVAAVTDTRTYDGTTNSVGVPTITPPLAAGDTATAHSQAFQTKHVGVGNKVLIPAVTINDGNGGTNYTVTLQNFTTGTINALGVTVAAVTDTRTYDGTTNSVGVPTITPPLVAGDTATLRSQAFQTKHVGVGNKVLIPAVTINDGNGGTNYTVTLQNFTTGTINPLGVTVAAVTDTRTYDGTTNSVGVPTITPPLAAGDTTTLRSQAFQTRHVGVGNKVLIPAVTINDGNGGTNYTVTLQNFTTGTITAAPLLVTALDASRLYGQTNPAFTASYSGFVGGETNTVLGGTLVLSTSADLNSPVGTYPITASGLTAIDYSITYSNGTLTVTAPAPTILPLTFVNTTNVVITWTAVSNGVYRVQFNSDLTKTNWTDLPGPVTARTNTASTTNLLTSTNRFYRVQVVP